MTDKPAPKRVRSRAPKGEAETLSLKIDSAEVRAMIDAEVAKLLAQRLPSIDVESLKGELGNLSSTRTQVAGAITATAEQHARLTSDLARVDGALQIVGQLIERLEAKAT